MNGTASEACAKNIAECPGRGSNAVLITFFFQWLGVTRASYPPLPCGVTGSSCSV